MMSSLRWGVFALALTACGNTGNDGGGGGDGDGDGGGGGGGGGNDEVPPDGAIAAQPVKFVVIGDTGKGNADQRRVAIAIRDLCQARGCDFVLMLGDNIYDAGVESTTDPQWQTKFEMPYSDVDLPFYVALGNHDYGGKLLVDLPGIGNEFDLGKIEVDYTQVSMKWNMPATYYTFTWGHVGFVVLDTNSILWEDTTYGDQASWLPTATAALADKRWIFTAGHHPYLSNGSHGNAGDYDAPELAGVSIPNPLPIQDGEAVKDFFDDHVCGISQVYFAGHDHSRQWLDEPTAMCGTQLIISGAGASTTEIKNRGNTALFEDASKVGFMYVVVDGDTFTGEFRDGDGALDFTRTFQHP